MIYSARLFSGTISATGSVVPLFTVAAGEVWIVRDIDAFTGDSSARVVFWDIDGNAAWIANVPASDVAYEWRGRQVLNPGEVFGAFLAAGEVVATISGYKLTA